MEILWLFDCWGENPSWSHPETEFKIERFAGCWRVSQGEHWFVNHEKLVDAFCDAECFVEDYLQEQGSA